MKPEDRQKMKDALADIDEINRRIMEMLRKRNGNS